MEPCGSQYFQMGKTRVSFLPRPARVLEKNGFLLEETRAGAVVKGGKAMDVKVYGLPR